MKNKKTSILALALALIVCVSFTACSSGEISGGLLPDDDFTPAIDDGAESELYSRYKTYERELPMAFVVFESYSHPSNFEFEKTDGGYMISKFVGTDTVLVLPPEKDGEAVVGIKEGAFDGKIIRALYITDGITKVERGALKGCSGLLTLRLPEIFGGYLGYVFGGGEAAENATAVPSSLDKLIIGNNVTKVEANAFAGCKTLSAVRFAGESVELGEFAFYGCSDLVYVDMETANKISAYAFGECSSLYEANCGTCQVIEKSAFYGCKALNKITLSRIGEGENDYLGYIFGADSIEYSAQYVPASLRTVEIIGPCKTVGARSFAECKYITNVILHEGIQKIDTRAFYACRSLEAIVIPDTCVSIGDDAFFGCDNLGSVAFGRRTESIGMQAFMGCKSLKEVTMPDRLTEIKPQTFYGCSALTKVELVNVTKIGKNAFKGCDALSDANVEGIEIASGNDALK